MSYITIKTKETNTNVEINPPIILGERSHISLVDIKIPEELAKNFTFTERQVISTDNLDLEILTENLEVPDFGDKEIIYILKIW